MSIEERKQKRIENYMKYRALADARSVTDYQVSKKIDLSQTVFSDWKSGKSQPKYDKLIKLAKYFDTTVEELLG